MAEIANQNGTGIGCFKPAIDMVPMPLFGVNLRNLMTKSEWSNLRRRVITERGQRCETCGKSIENSPNVKAHEDWNYTERKRYTSIASLTGIVLSCWHCHAVEHFGRTQNLANQLPRAAPDTINHFCRLNSVGPEAFEKHKSEAVSIWRRRSALAWRVEWGPFTKWVDENFGPDPFNLKSRNERRAQDLKRRKYVDSMMSKYGEDAVSECLDATGRWSVSVAIGRVWERMSF